MPEREEVSIESAYIVGYVGFSSLPVGAVPQDVTVIAERETKKARTTISSKGERERYCLVVTPGKWSVRAECGPVTSPVKQVYLEAGTCQELDFEFGSHE